MSTFEDIPKFHPENSTPPPAKENETIFENTSYEGITQETIDEKMKDIQEKFNLDLSDVKVSSTKPGEDLFDQYEIQYKWLQKVDFDFEKYLESIRKHGYDTEDIPTNNLKDIAREEGIILEGKIPGFATTAGKDEIIFFAIKDCDVLEMARKYAAKEGESQSDFSDREEAVEYLKGLNEKAFFHEIAHIIYSREDFKEWDDFINTNETIKEKVIELQSDKYGDAEQIPISEEAFADFAIEILSEGKIISRLGTNQEATSIIKRYLSK